MQSHYSLGSYIELKAKALMSGWGDYVWWQWNVAIEEIDRQLKEQFIHDFKNKGMLRQNYQGTNN